MGITVSKRKQPKEFRKKGFVFYRVKNNGVYVQDFKTKSQAQKLAKKMRGN